jgi:hypothetical protein
MISHGSEVTSVVSPSSEYDIYSSYNPNMPYPAKITVNNKATGYFEAFKYENNEYSPISDSEYLKEKENFYKKVLGREMKDFPQGEMPKEYPYDESIAKGGDLRVPAEFVHGTATLDQASRWANAFHDTVQDKQPLYYDVFGSDEKEVLFKLHYSQGNSSYASYVAFTKVITGYQFIGIINGSISNGKFSVLQP